MRAVLCKAYGPPESLVVEDVASPEPGPREVVVTMKAASVNFPDVLIIQNKYQFKPPLPFSPGSEVAGIVKTVGAEVGDFVAGDAVMAFTTYGAFAEEVKTEAARLLRIPDGMSYELAAAFGMTYATSDHALRDRGQLKPGETLLVLGAAGGVGSVMIQLAKALTGVRVIATASRDDSRQWATSMGADVVIDHHDLRDQALSVAPDGVDYLFSPHSKDNVATYAAIVRPFGHITAIDEPPGLDLLPLKEKSIAWHWELMFTRALFGVDMAAQQRLLAHAASLVEGGVLRSTLTTSIDDFTAAGLREAHRQVESGRMIGKVVVHR
jgi:NADPH2:quinone reductase